MYFLYGWAIAEFSKFIRKVPIQRGSGLVALWDDLYRLQRKNEQQNNAPRHKNNAAAGYKGPVKKKSFWKVQVHWTL